MKYLSSWWGIRPWKRHGLVLMVAGLVYIGVGVSFIVSGLTPERKNALIVGLSWVSYDTFAYIFIIAGVLSIISSRWPPVAETWGYMVLTGVSAGWSAIYALGVFLAHTPKSNMSAALVWGLVAFLWWAISGLLNPDRSVVIPHGAN